MKFLEKNNFFAPSIPPNIKRIIKCTTATIVVGGVLGTCAEIMGTGLTEPNVTIEEVVVSGAMGFIGSSLLWAVIGLIGSIKIKKIPTVIELIHDHCALAATLSSIALVPAAGGVVGGALGQGFLDETSNLTLVELGVYGLIGGILLTMFAVASLGLASTSEKCKHFPMTQTNSNTLSI